MPAGSRPGRRYDSLPTPRRSRVDRPSVGPFGHDDQGRTENVLARPVTRPNRGHDRSRGGVGDDGPRGLVPRGVEEQADVVVPGKAQSLEGGNLLVPTAFAPFERVG